MKKIKQLQNDYTTPEQSKRLLELGVPADSADQVYYDDIMWGAHEFIPNDRTYSEIVSGHENISIPCWSVGRLMEIWEICVGVKFDRWSRKGVLLPLIEDCIEHIEFALNPYTEVEFDFSKLDE